MYRFALAGIIVTMFACADPETTGSVEQAELCAPIICGNSPFVGLAPVPLLDETGVTPSPVGQWRIVSFEGPLGASLKLHVVGFHLMGFADNNSVAVRNGLVGTKITVEDALMNQYVIRVDAWHDSLRYFELGNDGTHVDSYAMSWTPKVSNDPPKNLCKDPEHNSHTDFDVLVYQGDLYDYKNGAVTRTGPGTAPWFNLACNGDGLAKMLLTRHADAAQDRPHQSDRFIRTSVLRGIRADYCGDGEAWTELNTPLDWANIGGWNVLNLGGTLEAVWDHGGAVCLSKPRLHTLKEIPCTVEGSGSPTAIAPCTDDQEKHWQNYGTFITYNPP